MRGSIRYRGLGQATTSDGVRLVDIHMVIFVCCVFDILYVDSETPCSLGWFGLNCNYRCRCTSNKCDEEGVCTEDYECVGGWFGPACQYADLAYNTKNLPEAVDGDDHTCLQPMKNGTIMITLNSSYYFTWFRITFGHTGYLSLLEMEYMTSGTQLACKNESIAVVDEKTADIFCDDNLIINGIIMKVEGLNTICSVYISGGRNVALKENATLNSVRSESFNGISINFTADRAVDSRRRALLRQGNGCAHSKKSASEPGEWSVSFSQPRTVNRYLIFNRLTSGVLLRNFTLVSEDSSGNELFRYQDMAPNHLPVYTIIHAPMSVSRVTIHADSKTKILCLCEVEVYGDSACGEGSYGLECEYNCGCPCNGYSFPLPVGCLVDTTKLIPEYRKDCPRGSYHPDCDIRCSQLCYRNNRSLSCDLKTGNCLQGCLDGYQGETCAAKCAPGYFGRDCKTVCNQNCLPGNTTSACHHINGHCLNGCLPGFSGPLCVSDPLPAVTEPPNYGLLGVVTIPGVLILSIIFCIRKRSSLPAREEKYRVRAVHT